MLLLLVRIQPVIQTLLKEKMKLFLIVLFLIVASCVQAQNRNIQYIKIDTDVDSVIADFNFRCMTTPQHTFTHSNVYIREFKSTVSIHRCKYCYFKEIYLRKSSVK